MLVLSGGCSFIWGSEMSDCRHHAPNGFSKSTWPALLANSIGADYHCVASAGSGNDIIARNIIDYCEKEAPGLVIVQWTFPWRFAFRFGYPTSKKMDQWCTIDMWSIDDEFKPAGTVLDESDEFYGFSETARQIAKTVGVQEFANMFFKHVAYEEYWAIYSSLKEIVGLQNYLKLKNIPFLFSCADNVLLESQVSTTPDQYIRMYQNQLDVSSWYMFPQGTKGHHTMTPRGFYQWAEENKYKSGPGGHPLEQAHSDASKIIQGKFNEVVKKHLEQNSSRNSIS
jgi:hypothetical protein